MCAGIRPASPPAIDALAPVSVSLDRPAITILSLIPAPTSRQLPTTVHLAGEIDIFSSHALRRRLLRTLQHSTDRLVLDLSSLSFCDTAGLAVLVGIQSRARSQGITVTLAAPRPYMSRLLRVTGLDRSFTMA